MRLLKKNTLQRNALEAKGNLGDTTVEKLEPISELKGSLDKQDEEDKLMHSVLQNNKDRIEEGKIINEAINQGISAFNPDLMFSQLVKNFQIAEQVYGERLIQLLSGYNASYIKRNIKIPEFQRELQLRLKERKEKLVDDGVLDDEGRMTSESLDLASLVLYMEELDHIIPKGTRGAAVHKKLSHYGDPDDLRAFRTTDRYKDVSVRDSLKLAIRRRHTSLIREDLKTVSRKSKGSVNVIYGLDASGSMKGSKLNTAKKAGIALAFQAVNRRDKVGLIVFKNDAQDFIEPTLDFKRLLHHITQVSASRETNFTAMIRKAIELFPRTKTTKHLMILTDALPTVGPDPENDTVHAVSEARAAGITISLVGISLDIRGERLAKLLVDVGQGRLYNVSTLGEVDKLVLHDYYSLIAK